MRVIAKNSKGEIIFESDTIYDLEIETDGIDRAYAIKREDAEYDYAVRAGHMFAFYNSIKMKIHRSYPVLHDYDYGKNKETPIWRDYEELKEYFKFET